jgi:hypothetical protein
VGNLGTLKEIIRGSANTAYIHQQESSTMSKFLQLTVHAHTTQLHLAPEKSLIHSSQQMIIELDKKLTLLPHPHPNSSSLPYIEEALWDFSLGYFSLIFRCVFQAYGGAFL